LLGGSDAALVRRLDESGEYETEIWRISPRRQRNTINREEFDQVVS